MFESYLKIMEEEKKGITVKSLLKDIDGAIALIEGSEMAVTGLRALKRKYARLSGEHYSEGQEIDIDRSNIEFKRSSVIENKEPVSPEIIKQLNAMVNEKTGIKNFMETSDQLIKNTFSLSGESKKIHKEKNTSRIEFYNTHSRFINGILESAQEISDAQIISNPILEELTDEIKKEIVSTATQIKMPLDEVAKKKVFGYHKATNDRYEEILGFQAVMYEFLKTARDYMALEMAHNETSI